MPFGKFQGKPLRFIALEEPSYFDYLTKIVRAPHIKVHIENMIRHLSQGDTP